MSGTNRSSVDLDPRRRRILFRAWHRGMREMDLIMGQFCDAEIATLSDDELDDFERLIDLPDRDLLGWITGSEATPPEFDSALLQKIKRFHTHLSPRFA